MPTIKRSSRAEQDLADVWIYITQDKLEAADRMIRRIDERLQSLLQNSSMGESMEEFRSGLRTTAVGNYVIYYSAIPEGIEVYRVLHAARRREDLL